MRKMKDSGVEWIGQIPLEWDVCKLKYLIGIKSGDAIRNEDISSDGLYQVFGGGEIIGYTNKQNANEKNLLIGRVGARCGCVTKPLNKVYATDNALVVFTKENRNYFYDVLVSADLNKLNSSNAQPLLTATKVKNVFVPHPPLAEQQKIADFLDERCGEIDSIRSDVQREIELLNDYKKSVITEAVTKGLNPKAKLKDSGIEWIGKIPEGWGLSKIGSIYSLRTQKVSDKNFAPLSVTMKGVLPQLENVAKTDDGDNRKLVRKGDFVINSRSDRRGSCGISALDGSVSLINLVLKPRTSMNPRYYNWLFHTDSFADEFYSWGHGIVDDLWTTRWQEMRNISVPVPPLSEQKAIADYLDEKCSAIDATIADKQRQLETLDEYKKSLIFEYVTGKKEVS